MSAPPTPRTPMSLGSPAPNGSGGGAATPGRAAAAAPPPKPAGRMERMRLHNFKSYEGDHSVPFMQFTAVIGPNGSGKSNLLDALAFVLGVRLDKDKSRASVLTDLLHKKQDETLEEVEAAGRGTAYVELIYLGADGSESLFRRTVTSKGTSTYSVDKRNQSFGQYKAALEQIGIWIEAKNFLVFQGDVESIAHKSPKELSELVDLLGGGARLKNAYEEAKANSDAKEEEFTKSFEHKRFLTKERNQMKQQKEEAEQYNTILEQFKASKINLTLFQLFHLHNDIEKKKGEAKQQQKEFTARNNSLDELHAVVKSLSADTARLRKEQAVTDKQLNKSTALLDKKRPQQIAIKQELLHLSKNKDKEKKKLEAAIEASTTHAAETKKLEKDLKKVASQLAQLQAALEAEDEKSKELQLAAAQLTEYNELKQKAALETADLTARIKAAQHEQRNVAEAAESMRIMMVAIEERADAMEQSQQELKARQEKNQDIVSQTKEQLTQFKKEIAAIREKTEATKARKAALEKELREVTDSVMEAQSERRARESDQKLHETVDTLKTHFEGVRGVLSELSQVMNPKYTLALSVAFGRHLDSVVVDTEATALQCIHYLREQRMFAITFIPLDTIKVKPVTESMRALREKGFPLAIDCVKFDEEIIKAFLYALSDTLICVSEKGEADALKKSQAMSQSGRGDSKLKVVTLAGTVIHKSGNLTGGTSGKGDGSAKLRAASDKSASKTVISEKEFTKLKQRQEVLLKQTIEVEAEISAAFRQQDEEQALSSKIVSSENRLKYAELDLATATKKLEQNEKLLKEMRGELEKSRPKLEELEADLAAKAEAVSRLESDLSKREEKIFKDFSRRVGVANIREFESERLKLAEQYNAEKVGLTNEQNNLQNLLDYERNRDLTAPINAAKAKIAEIEAQEKAKKKEMEAAEAESEKEQAKMADLLKESVRLGKEMEAKQTQLKQTKKQTSDLEAAVLALDKSVSTLRSQVTNLMLNRHEVLRQARVDNMDLPMVEGPALDKSTRKKKRQRGAKADEEEEEEEEEEEKGADVEMIDVSEEEAANSAELLAESRLRFDYSDLDEDYLDPESTPQDRERWRGEFLKVLAAHQEALDTLAPNLKSIQKFDEVSGKYNSTRSDWEDKKKAVKIANEAFETIKDQRHKMFMTAFEHISRAVAATYTQLTASRENPTGGNAYLHTESNDEPYLHGLKYAAMPPQKRYRDMKELSGGEKTVAALAMLFAIHSFRPAPFFVLDEIDAALDNINVTRVANYIRARSLRDGLQVVVISLKDSFYNKADALVGVYKDQAKQSSAHLTIDLTKYQA